MDGIEVIFQEGNQIPLTNNETLVFTLFFVLCFIFLLFSIRFLANFFATYEVRHQILDEEVGKLQGLLKAQKIQNESQPSPNKYLPKIELKNEQRFYLLLLLITGVTFFTKPYELEVINKNEAYLRYHLQKDRLIKKENWKLK